MICPHCSTAAKFLWSQSSDFELEEASETAKKLLYAECPNCQKLVIVVQQIKFFDLKSSDFSDVEWEKIVYPKTTNFQNSKDIPPEYLEDYEEAIKVLSASPKASAALTRRLLQNTLRNEFKISEKSLAKEIEKFVSLPHVPSHLTDAVDVVRIIGNLAAHPTKNHNTGMIVPVEQGEAEWLIEVIESLFDFVFIQPKKLEKRKEELNLKLAEIKKPKTE